MKTLRCKHGQVAIIDNSDYQTLSARQWTVRGDGYAYRYDCLQPAISRTGRAYQKTKYVAMHRDVFGPTHKGKEIDHINGDRLDNRSNNLRECTRTQNNMNRAKFRGASRFKGVSRNGKTGWMATIRIAKRTRYLGTFRNEFEAARAYNRIASKHYGKFARLNEI